VTVKVFAHKCKEVIPLMLSFAIFGIAIFSVWFFFFKPWPGVTATDEWILLDTPEKKSYSAGETVTWAKPKVCVPAGETTVQIYFVQELSSGLGTLQKLAYTRVFHLEREDCREPNITSVMIPAEILPGVYDIRLRACTNTPSPIDTCAEVPGPRITVRGVSQTALPAQ
jgi:hypothetical protein